MFASAIFFINESVATSFISLNNRNLTIFDDSDFSGIQRYSSCALYCAEKAKSSGSLWNFYFHANFTNGTTGAAIDGNCTVRFENYTNTYNELFNMSYNNTYSRFQLNKTFDYKGSYNFEVNCTNATTSINLTDSFVLTNTEPYIIKTAQGYIDFNYDGLKDKLQCAEDSLCYYDFSKNVSEDDTNDILVYNYTSANTTLTNFTLNSSGVLLINYTKLNNSLLAKQIELTVKDTESTTKAALLEVDITAVNDAPVFANLTNQSFNITTSADPFRFEYLVNITDEENNAPFSLNISFLNCSVAFWSTRNCSNSTGRELFNATMYSFNGTAGVLNISFSPQRNDVGNYTINFTITDLSNSIAPYNTSTSQVITFKVLAKNTPPTFTYVCENRNWTENDNVQCYINATDIEETANLTYAANYSWFIFNVTATNLTNGTLIQIANLTSGQNFSSFAVINFTPADSQVGNWSIDIIASDTGFSGDSAKSSLQTINFSISNINDNPLLPRIPNQTSLYNSNSYTIYLNVSDDDVLIPDKQAYNESLNFSSNISWVNISLYQVISSSNITVAKIVISPNSSTFGNYSILINVTDRSNLSNSTIFYLEILNNHAPQWLNISNNITANESNVVSINLTAGVNHTDAGQNLTFSSANQTDFPSFSLNSTTGIINFTIDDSDIGQHIINISVSDNISQSSLLFNFTFYNINDLPSIISFISGGAGGNISINNTDWSMNTTADANITIYMYVQDNDFKIPFAQKQFYNESLNVTTNLTKNGVASSLFQFRFSSMPSANLSVYYANFLADNSLAGNYTATISVADNSTNTTSISFNLRLSALPHSPSISAVGSQVYSIFENFSLDINASDEDEGSEPGAANFTYNITSINNNCLGLIINASNGIITNASNATIISLGNCAGSWQYNITIKDSTGLNSSQTFTLYVYDYPQLLFPASDFVFNLKENISSSLLFRVNHSAQDALNYFLYAKDALRNQTTGHGNNSNLSVSFTPNWTDETGSCAGSITLLLNVSNAKLSNSTSWNLTINHTNSPLVLFSNIGGASKTLSGTNYAEIILSDYFSDIDASDSCHRQNISFSYIFSNATNSSNGESISAVIKNWTSGAIPNITFSSTVDATINCTVIAYERNESNGAVINTILSNNFTVHILNSSTTVNTPFYGGGGSGGGGTTPIPETPKPTLLKILLPGPVSSDLKDKIILPIYLVNSGQVNLKEIQLSSSIAKNGSLVANLTSYFDRRNISSLNIGQKENVNLTIEINTDEQGTYEITVNATVKSPSYSDWGKIYLTVKNGAGILEKFIFIDELVVGNPECAEIKELVDEARKSFEKKEFDVAEKKLNDAISACGRAISQKPNPKTKISFQEAALNFISISAIVFLVLGVVFYIYKRRNLRRTPEYKELHRL